MHPLQYYEKHVAELRQEKLTVEQRFMQQSQELSAVRAESEDAAESAKNLQVRYDELSSYADQAQREKHAMAKQLDDETEALQVPRGELRVRCGGVLRSTRQNLTIHPVLLPAGQDPEWRRKDSRATEQAW